MLSKANMERQGFPHSGFGFFFSLTLIIKLPEHLNTILSVFPD